MPDSAHPSDDHDVWIPLCRVDEIQPGRAKYVEAHNRALCVVRVDDSASPFIQVFDDACPHAGQSMSGGHVQGECFVCPWHHWEFRLDRGFNPDNPAIRARTYISRIVGGMIFIRIHPLSRV